MTNYLYGKGTLTLTITAFDAPATVKIEINAVRYSEKVDIGKGETKRIVLPSNAEIDNEEISKKTVYISSTADISVVSASLKEYTGDSSVIFPISQLGTSYIAFTPDTGPAPFQKLVAIINGNYMNKIEIFGRNKIINLAPYEVYQLRSGDTLSGTKIKSTSPVAVLAGHQCSMVVGTCEHVFEQLVPVERLSNEYLIPAMHLSSSQDTAYVVAPEDNTIVSVFDRSISYPIKKSLNSGDVLPVDVSRNPKLIQSSKNIMVMYFSNNLPYDEFLTNVIPISEMSKSWTIHSQEGFDNTVVVIAEAASTSTISGSFWWRKFPANEKYVYAIKAIASDRGPITISGNSLMAAYVYGGKLRYGYATTGVCNTAFTSMPTPPDLCESVKCLQQEECRKGVCVPAFAATCHAVGDPHFRTFDGKLFNFQGTCSYVMVNNTKPQKGLTPFTILTKNNRRASRRVAYVRTVSVLVYGHTVVAGSQRGLVEFDGENTYLPLIVDNGKIKVNQRGMDVIISTDFGLEVKYDWNMMLYITVPSSYFQTVGGLCGNYNGDRRDDYTDPKGKELYSVIEFAKSWKVPDNDLFCNDDCNGQCPSCSLNLQEEYKKDCGVIAKTDGPFAVCHNTVDPRMYVDNCVYDVCINNGIRSFLCATIQSYVGACMSAGIKIAGNWRTISNCPLDCPNNMHYEPCGTACAASCADRSAPDKCTLPCVEGCQCNMGFVRSGDECVPVKKCGCTSNGRYYLAEQTFWSEKQCTEKCVCNSTTGIVECMPTKCKKSQVCDTRNGVKDCYPLSYSTCQGAGDPHYRTFDGKAFDFQGTCTYYLSKLLSTADSSLTPFEVLVKNENRGRNMAVAFTKIVTLTVYGYTIVLSKDIAGKVKVNNLFVNLPFEQEDGRFSIFRSGYFGVIRTDFDLTVKFNWDSHVVLTLPSTYYNEVGGLCGNWNDNANDEFLSPNNSFAATATLFGNSWKAQDDPGCSVGCQGKACAKCEATERNNILFTKPCGTIIDKQGPFRGCHDKVSPNQFYEDCVYDMCMYGGHSSALCSALTAYTAACQEALGKVESWRSNSFCRLIEVYQSGINIVVEKSEWYPTKLTYDTVSSVRVEIPSTFKNAVKGICGNYNGNSADDFLLPDGVQTTSVEYFAGAWVSPSDKAICQTGCGTKCSNPDKDKQTTAETACSLLMAEKGPFASCHVKLPPQIFFDDCVKDASAQSTDKTAHCRHIQRYVASCQEMGTSIDTWRNQTFCPITCSKNSHYELCADTCSSTCASLTKSRKCPLCQEGCQCDDGFLFDGGECKALQDCGCHVLGTFYKSGETTIRGECEVKCSCKAGVFTCEPLECKEEEICGKKDGEIGCYSKATYCPSNMHYEACGTSCAPTCADRDVPDECPLPCAEGCQCNPGFLLNGHECVPMKKCVCTYNGLYYLPDQTFWGQKQCTEKCMCNSQTGKVECTPTTCKNPLLCGKRNGVKDCYPLTYSTCQGTGDPHYRTFDGKAFDFQGTCTYYLSKLLSAANSSLTPFEVLVKNENRGRNMAVAFTKIVTLTVYGYTIVLSKDSPRQVKVNDLFVKLPFELQDGRLSIIYSGYFGVIRTDFGLMLKFNWDSHVVLTLPSTYYNEVGGLCGNWNDNTNDEFLSPNNTFAATATLFGNSWKVQDDPGCSVGCQGKACAKCEAAERNNILFTKPCGTIIDKQGPFRGCHDKVSPNQFYEDCVYDMCMYGGHSSSALCSALTAYTAACQEALGKVESWRSNSLCPATCKAHSHYEVCASGCSQTCSGLTEPKSCKDAPCVEGCTCDKGFVLSDSECVPATQCGCSYKGQYYQLGQAFFPQDKCQQRCVCKDNGKVQCEDAFTCKANEKCQVLNGVQGCFPESRAVCSVSGFGLYQSFDGKSFSVEGDCEYRLVETAQGTDVKSSFSVLVKQQYSSEAVFTRRVELQIGNSTITLLPGYIWEVQVNYVKTNLPVTLDEGLIEVYQSGINIVVETYFGLKLTYDTVSSVRVEIPSTFKNAVKGICGNYNGNSVDDFLLLDGVQSTSVENFVGAWVSPSDKAICQTGCGTKCSNPDKDKQTTAETACSLLMAEKGPFASCHVKLPPQKFFDECVKDTAAQSTDKTAHCRHIQRYVASCQEMGTSIDTWRNQTFCPITCSKNSHYELCADTCSSTCASLTKSRKCPLCQEGCQCDDGFLFDGGFLLNGDECVPMKKCGCTYNGRYYLPDQTFWGEKQCTEKCMCNSQTGKVECTPTTCKDNLVCGKRNGVKDCYPLTYSTCQGAGDPHYRTFDGKAFDFQGTCTYYLSKLLSTADSSLTPFEVLVKNENRGRNMAVAFTKIVTLTVYGYTIVLSKDSPRQVKVNDLFVKLPFELQDGRLSIIYSGYFGVIRTDFGLMLKFNWDSHVVLTLPSTYYNEVGGLCGNWNDNANDEFLSPNNPFAATATLFGNSWKVQDDPGCSVGCQGKACAKCEAAERNNILFTKPCGTIIDKQGPFRGCHDKVSPNQFYEDCVYDMCMYGGHSSALCSALTAYTAACQEALGKVESWRSNSLCPATCKAHSHYEVCASGCSQTCSGLTEPKSCKDAPCVEGCTCDKGFVLSDSECVPATQCGCSYKGQYYQLGQAFFPQDKCQQRCVCKDNGKVQCEDAFTCKANEKCQVLNGVQGCFPESRAVCSVSGFGLYQSFDGKSFSVEGDCEYRLVETAQGTDVKSSFSVLVKQQSSSEAVFTRRVELQIGNSTITLLPGYIWEVQVNYVKTNLPVTLDEGLIEVYQSGINIVVETYFGLKLTYDTVSSVRVEIPSTFKNAVKGICGNYNGNSADDFLLLMAFRQLPWTWVSPSDKAICQTGCGTKCSNPDKDKQTTAETACSLLMAEKGPFASCHVKLPPQIFFDDCVKDASAQSTDKTAHCRHIQRYVASCQEMGTSIDTWRNQTFCPVTCSKNSHYELCADTCSSTCASLTKSRKCPLCQEGCQCDDGFLFDGGECKALQDCGCHVLGTFYKSDETVTRGDCEEKCSCKAGVFTCEPLKCDSDQFCDRKGGVTGCYKKDPCTNYMCREQEYCIVQDNKALCVAKSKVSCIAKGDPHYKTFDGNHFSFQGTCTYTLVKTSGKDPTLTPFNIVNKNDILKGARGSFIKSATITVKGHDITFIQDSRNLVTIDGRLSNLPVNLNSEGINITLSDEIGVLQTNFGLEVMFNWVDTLMVTLSSSYYNNIVGMCGTYSNNLEDDYVTPNGNRLADITEWAKSWSVAESNSSCWHFPPCSDEKKSLYNGQGYCGMIENLTGPFAQCHNIIMKRRFTADCLFQMCLSDGSQEAFCNALNNYVSSCELFMADVSPEWKKLANC
ncbi:hypothetical protein DNTS_007800 [Danionella cerebrum]|uniref:VWFD domain-containing protein n=1 Tax=Danionella cerebrum TaxID=2873325 RepID=A0A553RPS5_9TELE|nr:hypothetical protein DNTS_007800 [Danionella translucida]